MGYGDDPSYGPPFGDSDHPHPYSQGPSFGQYGRPADPYGCPGQGGTGANGAGDAQPNLGTTQSPFPYPTAGSGSGYGYRPGQSPHDRGPSPQRGPYGPYDRPYDRYGSFPYFSMPKQPERHGSGAKIAIGVVAAVLASSLALSWALTGTTPPMSDGVVPYAVSQQTEADCATGAAMAT